MSVFMTNAIEKCEVIHMTHVAIITGGYLDLEFAKTYLKTLSYDKVFAVDKGLEYVDALGLIPTCLVGDFDTVNQDMLSDYEMKIAQGEISSMLERYPAMKDATDTEIAVDMAIKMGAKSITLFAATGSRLDHLLANLGLLLTAARQHVNLQIVDAHNRVRILSDEDMKKCVIKKDEQFGKYVSLVPITPIVEGVTLKGALYPLESAIIYQGESRTVSNEILEECIQIQLEKGAMLVLESKDN